jgi:hypothetical protein
MALAADAQPRNSVSLHRRPGFGLDFDTLDFALAGERFFGYTCGLFLSSEKGLGRFAVVL